MFAWPKIKIKPYDKKLNQHTQPPRATVFHFPFNLADHIFRSLYGKTLSFVPTAICFVN